MLNAVFGTWRPNLCSQGICCSTALGLVWDLGVQLAAFMQCGAKPVKHTGPICTLMGFAFLAIQTGLGVHLHHVCSVV